MNNKQEKKQPMTYVDAQGDGGLERIIDFLNSHGIACVKTGNPDHFMRCIVFNVHDITYQIEWFINESTLFIGTSKRGARIPFKHLYFDRSFPLVGGNQSIGFSYVKNESKGMFDREFPYEVFRIPLELWP